MTFVTGLLAIQIDTAVLTTATEVNTQITRASTLRLIRGAYGFVGVTGYIKLVVHTGEALANWVRILVARSIRINDRAWRATTLGRNKNKNGIAFRLCRLMDNANRLSLRRTVR